MKLTETPLKDCFILEPKVFGDARGFFQESFNQRAFNEATKTRLQFVQDNHSKSKQGVLRGLHYQIEQPQAKLVRVTSGEVYDVAVDLRKSSYSFGQWFGILLNEENKKQLWIPSGFAHGFLVLSEIAEMQYKTTDYYNVNSERCIIWNDQTLQIEWNLKQEPFLSEKDLKGAEFLNSPYFE